MNKNTVFGVIALLIGLAAITAFFVNWTGSKNSSTSYPIPTATPIASRNLSSASWVSNAMTVKELMAESDLVVRVRVSEAPVTRVLRHELPVWDENNKIVGSTVSEALFSDTVFEIIKTYRGKPRLNIAVMQTGGFDPTVSSSIEEVADDPLYKAGEEYILFLVDISGDKVQAPDRELYRIVNPFGRYRVDGENVFSYGQNPGMDTFSVIPNISELEIQIEQAISLIPTPAELLTETLTALPLPTESPTETPSPTVTPTELPTETFTLLPVPTDLPTHPPTPTEITGPAP